MFASAAAILACALLGSIPTAFIVTKLKTGSDIRTLGSGNSGATNAFRVLGLPLALAVLVFDFCKGFFPVFFILASDIDFGIPALTVAVLASAAAVAGHMFPVYIGWKGGKGVATGAGVLTALYPLLFPACLAVFLPVFFLSRKMSLASLCTALSVPFWYAFFAFFLGAGPDPSLLLFTLFIPAMVIAKHWKNIRALRSGNEKKIF